MTGDGEILALLNEQLTSELTAINQYFLHSKLQASWGYTELAVKTRAESFEEMQHAELLTDRILLLGGLPNYQRLFSLTLGQSVREQFEGDLGIEREVVDRLKPGIRLCREPQTHQREPARDDPRRRGAAHRLLDDPAESDGPPRGPALPCAMRLSPTGLAPPDPARHAGAGRA